MPDIYKTLKEFYENNLRDSKMVIALRFGDFRAPVIVLYDSAEYQKYAQVIHIDKYMEASEEWLKGELECALLNIQHARKEQQ